MLPATYIIILFNPHSPKWNKNKLVKSVIGNRLGKNIKFHSYNKKALNWHSRTWLDFPVGVCA